MSTQQDFESFELPALVVDTADTLIGTIYGITSLLGDLHVGDRYLREAEKEDKFVAY